jgi:hypothetical protein
MPTTDRPLAAAFTVSSGSSMGALLRRLALAGLLLTALTILASIALAA